jgi:hypothetical protein
MPTQKKLQWGQDYLKDKGYLIEGEPQALRLMPWSKIYSFKTNQGQIYLKSMAREFSNEPFLLNFLLGHSFKKIPKVIAINQRDHCFLMEEAGKPLRDSLKENFSKVYICRALKAYTDIQLKSRDYIDPLLKLGVKDKRIRNLPFLYKRFLSNEDLLKDDGMEEGEVKKLKTLSLKFQSVCNELSTYAIPATLEHGDFHDNNILVQGSCVTICDFGDTVISHPFFSIVNFLKSAEDNHCLKENDQNFEIILTCYLNEWTFYEKEDRLREVYKLAQAIWPFMFALNLSRVRSCKEIDKFSEYKTYMTRSLRRLIKDLY